MNAEDLNPLHEQIYRGIRDAIVRNQLRAGQRVSSSRALSADLRVSRFTVVTALDRLIAEGYLVSRRGSGTFVADVLPDTLMTARARPLPKRSAASPAAVPRISARYRYGASTVITGPRLEDGPRAFHPRRPALNLFPTRLGLGSSRGNGAG